jgi:HD-GYP domain-containing protein (c-di-GMP phosphodiesterase class II)
MREDAPLYNSKIINNFVDFIKKDYPRIDIDDLLHYLNIETYQVQDEGHWFTQDEVNRFYERLVLLTGNPNLAREAGRHAFSENASGVMKHYVLGLVGPSNAYKLIGKYVKNFTRSSTYATRSLDRNRIEISVKLNEGVQERKFQCENRIGYFEAIAFAFTHRLPEIRHDECIFTGGHVCRYEIRWREQRSDYWKKLRNYLSISFLVLLAWIFGKDPLFASSTALPAAVVAVLALSLYAKKIEKDEIQTSLDNMLNTSESLMSDLSMNYNNALLINEIGSAISKQVNIDSILKEVTSILESRLDFDRGMILLADKDEVSLGYRAGFGHSDEDKQILKDTSFHLNRPDSKGVFVVSYREKKPFLVNDVDDIKLQLSEHSLQFAKMLGVKSFICCPIVYEDQSMGILAVDNLKTKRPFLQKDINLLMGIAPEIGTSIRNAELIMLKEKQFKSIVKTLAATIDARDTLTAGHSENVTKYSVGICKELGMSREFTEMIAVASMLHDFGKIGVSDLVLKKNGRLTAEEINEIRTHAEKTRKILDQVSFDGIYKDVPSIAGSHHEKYDGSGYPEGLYGDEIPLGARIIAVADFYEAITSKRHYRDPMPIDEAVSLLHEKTGVHFDRSVVNAFMRYLYTKYSDTLLRQSLRRDMPGRKKASRDMLDWEKARR